MVRRDSLVNRFSKVSDTVEFVPDFLVDRKSFEAEKVKEETDAAQKSRDPPPSDSFGIIKFMVVTVGLTSLLANGFVIKANDFWMYKFRDPLQEQYDASNRTSLQSNFTSAFGVAMAIPTVFGLIFIVTLSHKIKSGTRIIFSYSLLLFFFLLLMLFADVDTDSWQRVFFATTMGLMAGMSLMFLILVSSLIVIVPRFPPIYFKLFIYGQGLSGIFSAILQVVSLTIGKTSSRVGLIYFGSGTAMYVISLVLYIIGRCTPFYQYYVDEGAEDTKKSMPKWADMKRILARIWPVLLLMACCLVGGSTTHPNVTNLIVSENYGNGSLWTEKYFVPVVTFLLGDVVGLVGKVFARDIITPKNAKWFILFNLIRTIVFAPLFVFCNVRATHRSLQPIFVHDWQYIIILSTFLVSLDFIQTCCLLSIPNFKDKDEDMDLYYLLLQITLIILALLSAPLGVIVVNLL